MKSQLDEPLVSIVLPLYKVEEYVSDAIDSVLSQSYQNLQVILVDDGSPDVSSSIAAACLEKSMRNIPYKLVRKDNGGVSSARNTGIDKADGEYVICPDPDDVLAPDSIAELVQASRNCQLDVVVQDFAFITDEDIPYKPCGRGLTTVMSKKEALNHHLLRTKSFAAPAIMFRRSLWPAIQFDEAVCYAEDVQFVWELLSKCNEVGYVDRPLYGYRIREGSTMTASSIDKIVDGVMSFEQFSNRFTGSVNKEWMLGRWCLGVCRSTAKRFEYSYFKAIYDGCHMNSLLRGLKGFPQARVRILYFISQVSVSFLYFTLRRL